MVKEVQAEKAEEYGDGRCVEYPAPLNDDEQMSVLFCSM
jgi:hypothetical protein